MDTSRSKCISSAYDRQQDGAKQLGNDPPEDGKIGDVFGSSFLDSMTVRIGRDFLAFGENCDCACRRQVQVSIRLLAFF